MLNASTVGLRQTVRARFVARRLMDRPLHIDTTASVHLLLISPRLESISIGDRLRSLPCHFFTLCKRANELYTRAVLRSRQYHSARVTQYSLFDFCKSSKEKQKKVLEIFRQKNMTAEIKKPSEEAAEMEIPKMPFIVRVFFVFAL